jgi:hypothetical protein
MISIFDTDWMCKECGPFSTEDEETISDQNHISILEPAQHPNLYPLRTPKKSKVISPFINIMQKSGTEILKTGPRTAPGIVRDIGPRVPVKVREIYDPVSNSLKIKGNGEYLLKILEDKQYLNDLKMRISKSSGVNFDEKL